MDNETKATLNDIADRLDGIYSDLYSLCDQLDQSSLEEADEAKAAKMHRLINFITNTATTVAGASTEIQKRTARAP